MLALPERIMLAFGVALMALASLSAEGYAQSCDAREDGTCLAPAAECNPIDLPFSGNQGICKTIGPKHDRQCLCVPAPPPSGPFANAIVGNALSAPVYVNLYWDATWDADNPTMP